MSSSCPPGSRPCRSGRARAPQSSTAGQRRSSVQDHQWNGADRPSANVGANPQSLAHCKGSPDLEADGFSPAERDEGATQIPPRPQEPLLQLGPQFRANARGMPSRLRLPFHLPPQRSAVVTELRGTEERERAIDPERYLQLRQCSGGPARAARRRRGSRAATSDTSGTPLASKRSGQSSDWTQVRSWGPGWLQEAARLTRSEYSRRR
jgi:hypothetical protein